MGPCVYDNMSPCENCGKCNNNRFNDDSAECNQCGEIVVGRATVYVFHGETYCSLQCIIGYLNDNDKIEEHEYTGNEKVEQCESCNEQFSIGDTILKYDGHFFCSEDCIEEYLSDRVTERDLWSAQDYEDDYGDRLYDAMKDEELFD